nr:hypothetical protein [Tanacetum cinerariifolium]
MAIFVVSISSDSSKESVGTSTAQFILFGTIPTAIWATVPIVDPPVVHDDTPLIPTETPTIPPVVSTLSRSFPFMYIDSSDSDTSERPPSHDPYEVTVARWSSRVDLHRDIHLIILSSDDSSLDSPSDSSSGYSSNTSSVSLATPVPRSLSPVRVDLLPPRKRIRGLVSATTQDDNIEESYEAYTEPDIDSDVQAYIDADTAAAEAVETREADVGVEVSIGSDEEDKAESEDRGTIEIRVDRVIEEVQIDKGHRMLVTSQQSVVMLDRIGVLERDNMRLRGMLCVERERVDSMRCHMSYTQ